MANRKVTGDEVVTTDEKEKQHIQNTVVSVATTTHDRN